MKQNADIKFLIFSNFYIKINKIKYQLIKQDVLQRMFVIVLLNKYNAIFFPFHSNQSQYHVPLDILLIINHDVPRLSDLKNVFFGKLKKQIINTPMKWSPSNAPAITRTCFGRPTKFRNIHFGIVSPAKPALITPK